MGLLLLLDQKKIKDIDLAIEKLIKIISEFGGKYEIL